MWRAWLALACVVAACGADDDATCTIDMVVAGTLDPLEDGSVFEVDLRPQGVYGSAVDLHVVGVAVDDVPGFGVEIVSSEDVQFANQRYQTTSTGEPLGDGSFTIRGLPVVFADAVARDEVDGQPAVVIADIESDPPAQSRVDVTLVVVGPSSD